MCNPPPAPDPATNLHPGPRRIDKDVRNILIGAVISFLFTVLGAAFVHYGFVMRLEERINNVRDDEYFKGKVATAKREMDSAKDHIIKQFPGELDLVALSGRVPVGTIIPFYGTTSPSQEYLICDGQPFNSTDYPKLFDILTKSDPSLKVDEARARTPNLANRFLRGADGLSRPTGKQEDDAVKRHDHPHSHAIATPETRSGVSLNDPKAATKSIIAAGENGADSKYSLVTSDSTPSIGRVGPVIDSPIGPGFADETRPRNTAVLFLIRAK